MGFPGDSVVKNLPATQEMQVQSLGWEDHLEKGMATHSGILARGNPMARRVRHKLATKPPLPLLLFPFDHVKEIINYFEE